MVDNQMADIRMAREEWDKIATLERRLLVEEAAVESWRRAYRDARAEVERLEALLRLVADSDSYWKGALEGETLRPWSESS